ncbi:MAG: FxsA family protein [Thermoguttaceae bacterium]|jgi:UPF0716 protein FxsA
MLEPRRWLLLLIAAIVADVAMFSAVAWYLGWAWALANGAATGLLGLAVGVYCVWRYGGAVATRLDNDDRVDDHLLSGLLLLVAAFLLVMPGFISGVAGLVMLVPAVRRRMVRALRRRSVEGPAVLKIGEDRAQPSGEHQWPRVAA